MFGKTKPEDYLLYADTEIVSNKSESDNIIISAEGYDGSDINLRFLNAKVIINKLDDSRRIEKGKILRLPENRKRIMFYDDDNILFLEIEYDNCEHIK